MNDPHATLVKIEKLFVQGRNAAFFIGFLLVFDIFVRCFK